MIPPISVVGRASGQLTGGSATDWCADLDTYDTFDGQVTVDVVGTKGSLDSIILGFVAGPDPEPTGWISNGILPCYETITAATWRRSVTFRTCARYFRAAVRGVGTASGSDAVVTW